MAEAGEVARRLALRLGLAPRSGGPGRSLRSPMSTIDHLREQGMEISQLRAEVAELAATVDRLHRTMVEADPQMALDVVNAVRADVAALAVSLQRDTLARAAESSVERQ